MKKYSPKKIEFFEIKDFHNHFAIIPEQLLKRMLSPRQFKKIHKWNGVIVFDKIYAFAISRFLESTNK